MQFERSFQFSEDALQGSIVVNDSHSYQLDAGYGFATAETSRNEDLRDSWPGEYFPMQVPTFIVDVPNGNYRVTVRLGHRDRSTLTTVKAGLGRLMLSEVQASPGQVIEETFAFPVEDGQLKLAFGGPAPSLQSIAIQRVVEMPTLFLAGDSTMTDQPSGGYPYCGWGQMLSAFFDAGIAVSNHARSGRSTKSFIHEGRLTRIWKRIQPGDFLLVQFAHNDEKDNEGGTKPYTTYQENLRRYIDGARGRNAFPVLASPIHRRFFDPDGHIRNTHGDYMEAMREVAAETGTPFLDVAAKSQQLFEKVGDEATKQIFLWAEPGQYPAFPDGLQDNTHFTEYGGFLVAKLAAECIAEAGLPRLSSHVRNLKR